MRYLTLMLMAALMTGCSTVDEPSRERDNDWQSIYAQANYATHLVVDWEYEETVYDPNGKLAPHEEKRQTQGVLSGIVFEYENQPYMLTAGHLMSEGHQVVKVTAYFKDGSDPKEVEIVGYHMGVDIALLKFKDRGLNFAGSYAKFGDSDLLRPLDQVMAIGSQMGIVWHAPTVGMVMQTLGESPYYKQTSIIAHMAPINPGNSGGPLINGRGEVVGVNVMAFRGFNAISLAVPINEVKKILPFLKDGGKVNAPSVPGLTLTDDWVTRKVVVAEVTDDSLAAQAGFKKDDIILGCDGRKPLSCVDIYEYLSQEKKPGQKVYFLVQRSDDVVLLELILQ